MRTKRLRVEIPTFVKWAGGKKQLINQFKPYFPREINRYFDPFVGGGAVAFYIIKNYEPKEVYLSDVNEELINTYKIIQNKNTLDDLIAELKEHKKNHNEEYYYKIRKIMPEDLSDVKRAARLIYLNKTCFNGLYRVNSKGGFNVPIGSSKNPLICPEIDLRNISSLIQNAVIEVKPFYEIEKDVKQDDFVYFDPPYHPLKKESFTTYTKEQFLEEAQEKLAEIFKALHKKGVNVMLSNSDTPFIMDLYKEYKETTYVVKANRMINCDATKRGKINEIVVTTYDPHKWLY